MLRAAALLCLAVACWANPAVRSSAPSLDGKIVGGNNANIEDYPYQLSMQSGGSHICGASIISDTWALTAAHCCGDPVESLSLRAGSSIRNSGGTVHQVVQKIVHSQYGSVTKDYDLALLRVGTKFEYGPGVAAITLPVQNQTTADGVMSTISGWGTLAAGGSLPSQLQVVFIPVTTEQYCKNAYSLPITARMICAGVPEGGVDSCQGDSGGPMVVGGLLVGAVSWGRGCADPGYPGVYARVASMRDWIRINSGV